VLCIGEIECAFIYPCGLQDVKVARKQSKRNGPGYINSRVFELAFDKKRDRDKSTCSGLGKVPSPLIDADSADHLLGLGDLVHLGQSGRSNDRHCANDGAEERGSHSLLTRLDAIDCAKSYDSPPRDR